MVGIVSKPDTEQKLKILSADAQYDLACACGSNQDDRRHRSTDGRWIYPVTLPNGGKSVLFKTLLSNVCNNDCRYCPLREQQDLRRCSLTPEETVKSFLGYVQRKQVFGLFLSSSLIGTADATMQRLNDVAHILRRRHGFRGYIHLKVIPGASAGAIEQAISLADAVSVNIETAGAANMAQLSAKKDYVRDIIEPIKLISQLTAKGNRYQRVKQTTQFIVGAAGESDAEIVKYMWGLYDRLHLHRVYFSAYQQGLGDEALAGEQTVQDPVAVLTREHRLYQVDFLMRQYGFTQDDVPIGADGRLDLLLDPKQTWADQHPEFFPVSINRASRQDLLKVPGLGPTTVRWILKQRKSGPIGRIEEVGKVGVRLKKAKNYLSF